MPEVRINIYGHDLALEVDELNVPADQIENITIECVISGYPPATKFDLTVQPLFERFEFKKIVYVFFPICGIVTANR